MTDTFRPLRRRVNCVIVPGGPGNRMSPRAVIRGGVLTFTAVDAADEGEYTCKALNTHGEHTARVSLIVQSMLPAKVYERPREHRVFFTRSGHNSVFKKTKNLAELFGSSSSCFFTDLFFLAT